MYCHKLCGSHGQLGVVAQLFQSSGIPSAQFSRNALELRLVRHHERHYIILHKISICEHIVVRWTRLQHGLHVAQRNILAELKLDQVLSAVKLS